MSHGTSHHTSHRTSHPTSRETSRETSYDTSHDTRYDMTHDMTHCIVCNVEIDDTGYGYFGYCSRECLHFPHDQEYKCYICGEMTTQIISHSSHEGLSFCSDMCLHEFEEELDYHNALSTNVATSSFSIEPEPEPMP